MVHARRQCLTQTPLPVVIPRCIDRFVTNGGARIYRGGTRDMRRRKSASLREPPRRNKIATYLKLRFAVILFAE